MAEREKHIKHFRDLDVYRLAFQCAMEIFQITKTFPSEERYSLTDEKLDSQYEHIIGMLNSMEKKAQSFCFSSS